MTDPERIIRLEEKVNTLDKEISDIKAEIAEARKRDESSALAAMDLKGQLVKLIDELKTHQKWHEKVAEKPYKITDIVLAIGMLCLAVMQFFKK